jgi:hypothetical protein
MEMTSSAISDLDLSFDGEIFFPTSMVVLKDYNYLDMGVQILLRQIHLGSFLMVAAGRIIIALFVPVATSSTMVIHILGSL